jgi:hypothetical protein
MWRSILTGIVWALLGAFPLAALVALCYRFPIPFSGYESGLMAVPLSLLAVAFYELFGGFVVLAALGAAAGIAANLLANGDARRERWLTLTFALAGDLVAVILLAVLDKIIGNW